jgi:PAS domain S-box-containing protein
VHGRPHLQVCSGPEVPVDPCFMADKKRKRLSLVSADGPKDVLQAVEDTLRSGSIPEGPVIPADDEAQKKLDEILAGIVDTQQFALAMAGGDLSLDLAVKGHMAGSLKALQSSLRHLTWQAGQIAGGDLTQRVNFMGEFSESFNAMVEHLSEDKIHRDQREEELRSMNSALAREVAGRGDLEGKLRLQNQIFETIAEGIYLIRAEDGVIVETNSKFDLMFGYEKGELIGRHVSVVNTPQETKSLVDTAGEIMSVLNASGEWRGELKNIKKDGTTFWCLAVVSTFNHPGFGKVWIAAHTDITARKLAEEALKDSEQKFREIFNDINDGIELHEVMNDGLPGKYLEVNEVTCRMLGYTREELLQHNPLDFTTEYHNRPLEEIGREILTTGHSRFETGHLNRAGVVVPVEINAHVFRHGDKTLVLSVVRDITARRKAEDDLRKSEERFRIMFDESPISLWEEDFSDIKHWIDTRKEEGVRDFRSYFETHPEDILSCIRR